METWKSMPRQTRLLQPGHLPSPHPPLGLPGLDPRKKALSPASPAPLPREPPADVVPAREVAPLAPERSQAPGSFSVEKPRGPERPQPARKRGVAALAPGLEPTRSGWVKRLGQLFTGKKELDPALLDEIEKVLLTADIGVRTSQKLLSELRESLDRHAIKDPEAVWSYLPSEECGDPDLGCSGRRLHCRPPFRSPYHRCQRERQDDDHREVGFQTPGSGSKGLAGGW
jgi:fused signal recognition particle receptor